MTSSKNKTGGGSTIGTKKGAGPVYIGVDIGTGGTRAVAYDEGLAPRANHYEHHETKSDESGRAELDPKEVLKGVRECLGRVVEQTGKVYGVSFASILPSLVGFDKTGEPLTPLYTWADTRGRKYVEDFGQAIGDFHSRTGCVLHPMYSAVKLIWLREEQPKTFDSVPVWGSIKSYVLSNLTTSLVEDYGVASASGLLNTDLHWDDKILDFLELSPDRLPRLVPTGERLDGEIDLPGLIETPVYPGAGDGMLAHLSTCGLAEGQVSSTIGTSGALRMASPEPLLDPEGKIWNYNLFPDWWIGGGALNNGGLTLKWFVDNFYKGSRESADEDNYGKINRLVQEAEPGASGLIFAPFLTGERSPEWRPYMKGGLVGLRLAHGEKEIARAIMEGVTYRLKAVRELLKPYLPDEITIRASGGYTRSRPWLRLQADVFNSRIEVPAEEESAAKGAAMIAMRGEGSLDEFPEPEIREVIRPNPERAKLYEELYEDHEEFYRFLEGFYRARG